MSAPRALIVDDDEPIRNMLATVVRHQGIEVDTARDGIEAIESIDRDGYKVIVLDLMMPRVDGYGVLQHIREHNPALLNCTILATAVPERDLGHSLKDSIYRIHSKPFDIQRLIEDVRHCAEIAAN